jgi:cell division protease FtsH
MNKKISFSIWYIFLAIWAVILVHDFIHALQKIEGLPYSEFGTLTAACCMIQILARVFQWD